MSKEVNGFIAWLRSWFDDIYAEKGSSSLDLELDLIPKSENSNGVICVKGGNVNYDLDKVYPIGSIYMSVNSTNPSTLFGGTWQQLEDTFLYATSGTADTGYQATSGSKDSIIVSHTHTTYSKRANITYNSSGNTNIVCHSSNTNAVSNGENGNFVASKGESGTDKNMPPYMNVYMWKRIQ